MGRSLGRLRMTRTNGSGEAATPLAAQAAWWDEVARNARAHGALPYVVEGFTEIVDAVRRGHPVLVRRERAQVSDDLTVFEHAPGPRLPHAPATTPAPASDVPIVAILRFDVGSARFVLQDPSAAATSVQLTPRRLASYLDAPSRSMGVALGA
jgi:hypothetical protein